MNPNAKLAAILLAGVAAGAAPSLLSGDSAVLVFDAMTIRSWPQADGGVEFQVVACANVVRPGAKSAERVCSNRQSPDAGEFLRTIEHGMQMAKHEYENPTPPPRPAQHE